MSIEGTYQWIAEGKIRDALTPDIVSATYKIEHLIDEMMDNDPSKQDEGRLEQMKEHLVQIRVFVGKLK